MRNAETIESDCWCSLGLFFFCKQKTAYEMRISDWSSDVCSSDLLNGDGRPEAVVTSYGTYCYGMTGQGYALLSKQPNGGWRMMDGGQGIPKFLATKGAGGWPDISIGGPGFCFPVVRWNGKEYAIQDRKSTRLNSSH